MKVKMKPVPNYIKKIIPLLVLCGLIAVAYLNNWHQLVTLESFHAQKAQFQSFTGEHLFLAIAMFSGAYIMAVALSLPIATLLTLLGGFLFGKWFGALLVITSATIGATIIFMIARTSIGDFLRKKAGKLYDKIANNMNENAVGYLLFMRLVPIFPFVLVNIIPALFNVPVRIFILTTFFGILPGSFVYVNVGEALGSIESLSDLVSPQTLIAFALLGLFALIPTLYKQFKEKKK